jgi:hypothetical protein
MVIWYINSYTRNVIVSSNTTKMKHDAKFVLMYCHDITDILSKVMFNIHVNLIYSGTNYFLIGWGKGTVFFLEKNILFAF